MRQPRQRRGITLVECLVSIVIFGIGILGAAQCLLAAYSMTRLSQQDGLATLYAQEQLENVISLGVSSTGTSTLNITDPAFPQKKLSVVTTTTAFGTGTNLNQVTVTASWRSTRAKMRNVILETVMPNRILP